LPLQPAAVIDRLREVLLVLRRARLSGVS
jgi:hypothetical protein